MKTIEIKATLNQQEEAEKSRCDQRPDDPHLTQFHSAMRAGYKGSFYAWHKENFGTFWCESVFNTEQEAREYKEKYQMFQQVPEFITGTEKWALSFPLETCVTVINSSGQLTVEQQSPCSQEIIDEDTARNEKFCRGCGCEKEAAPAYPVVCWSCWKGEGLPFKPFKYFSGSFEKWLTHVKKKTGKVFTSPR